MIEISAAKTMCRHDNLLSCLRMLYYTILADGNGMKALSEDAGSTMVIIASPRTLAGLEAVTRGSCVDFDGPLKFNGIRCLSSTSIPDDTLHIECGGTVLGALIDVS